MASGWLTSLPEVFKATQTCLLLSVGGAGPTGSARLTELSFIIRKSDSLVGSAPSPPPSWKVFWRLSQGPFPKVGGVDSGTGVGWGPWVLIKGNRTCKKGLWERVSLSRQSLGMPPKRNLWRCPRFCPPLLLYRSPGAWGVRGLRKVLCNYQL